MAVNIQLKCIDETIALMGQRRASGHGPELAMCRLSLAMTRRLRQLLAEARYNARVLAHSYETGSNPPKRVVTESLRYPIDSGKG